MIDACITHHSLVAAPQQCSLSTTAVDVVTDLAGLWSPRMMQELSVLSSAAVRPSVSCGNVRRALTEAYVRSRYLVKLPRPGSALRYMWGTDCQLQRNDIDSIDPKLFCAKVARRRRLAATANMSISCPDSVVGSRPTHELDPRKSNAS